MPKNNYHALLERLLSVSLHGGMKLGLENCHRLNHALGYPTKKFPAIHVAGTNGKGSVVTKIAAALQQTGKRVGLYTSPHIACFRERIRINGEMIPEEAMEKHLAHLFNIAQQNHIQATFFELTTLMAFDYFADQNIDIAVIETGLGGRLDATNIVNTQLSVITSISLEHMDILGNSIEAIAHEKAGIIKPGIPVVLGPRLPVVLFEEVAKSQNSPCIKVTGVFDDYYAENDAIAKAALETLQVDSEAILKALKALPPCRLEIFMPPKAITTTILDVAHNPDGMQQLLKAIKKRYGNANLRFVLGISLNKDLKACLSILKATNAPFHLVEALNGRAAPKEIIKEKLIELSVSSKNICCEANVGEAIAHASKEALKKDELVVVCGTFFIMAEARKALSIIEPQDPQDLNERKMNPN